MRVPAERCGAQRAAAPRVPLHGACVLGWQGMPGLLAPRHPRGSRKTPAWSRPPQIKSWAVSGSLFPCEMSEEGKRLAEASVAAAVAAALAPPFGAADGRPRLQTSSGFAADGKKVVGRDKGKKL